MTAPNWRTEAARAGIEPWPYCRRTMANLDGKAVEVPDLSDPGTMAEFLRRFVTPGGSSTTPPRYVLQAAGSSECPTCCVSGTLLRRHLMLLRPKGTADGPEFWICENCGFLAVVGGAVVRTMFRRGGAKRKKATPETAASRPTTP